MRRSLDPGAPREKLRLGQDQRAGLLQGTDFRDDALMDTAEQIP